MCFHELTSWIMHATILKAACVQNPLFWDPFYATCIHLLFSPFLSLSLSIFISLALALSLSLSIYLSLSYILWCHQKLGHWNLIWCRDLHSVLRSDMLSSFFCFLSERVRLGAVCWVSASPSARACCATLPHERIKTHTHTHSAQAIMAEAENKAGMSL